MFTLSNKYLKQCRECLTGIEKDENLYFPHSLPICIFDAVFSIGIRYEMARKAWINYSKYFNLAFKEMQNFENGEIDNNEHTIDDFIKNFHSFKNVDDFLSQTGVSRHRTSSRNGILKIEAVFQIAEIMKSLGINTVQDFRSYPDRKDLDDKIRNVKGQRSGIMLKYLYMLAGSPDICKPDRHIMYFYKTYYPDIEQNQIQELMNQTVKCLKPDYPDLTVRMLDNAIWKYQRSQK